MRIVIVSQRTVVLDLADKLGALLGKGGMTIRNISELSGARLDIDKETNTVSISGQPEEVCFSLPRPFSF
jgi:polyribonucleotide nucleotidyltransferase